MLSALKNPGLLFFFLFLGTEAFRVPEVTYIFNILIEKWGGIFIANETEYCDGEAFAEGGTKNVIVP